MALAKTGIKSPDDVVIVAAVRTPMTKATRGQLRDTAPEILLAHVLREVIKRGNVDPALIEDVMVGNVLQPSAGAFPARIAQFLADMPIQVPVSCVNRFCASGLETVALIAAKIRAGLIDVGIGAGVESMSFYEMKHMLTGYKLAESSRKHNLGSQCLIPMGITSDNVCKAYGLSREELDTFALSSHQKAEAAVKGGLFTQEIVPIKIQIKDEDGMVNEVLVTKDGGIRMEATIDQFEKLQPVFTKDGLTTSGNSSQMTDGAAAVLLMKRSVAEKLKVPILGKFVSHAVIGVAPDMMGIGPSEAIPLALEAAEVEVKDVDIFEINEAFASVAVFAIKKLKLDPAKVNPKGGAIAFGHPLGCTGARQVATLLTELKRTGKKLGVISMCLGSGMGAAAVIECE